MSRAVSSAGVRTGGRGQLGVAAAAGRFAEADLPSIIDHLATGTSGANLVLADEATSTQPGTNGWAGFTTGSTR